MIVSWRVILSLPILSFDWFQIDVLVSTKGLSEQLVDGCFRLLDERKVLVKLLAKCQTISSSIQERLVQVKAEGSSKVCFFCIQTTNNYLHFFFQSCWAVASLNNLKSCHQSKCILVVLSKGDISLSFQYAVEAVSTNWVELACLVAL